MLTQWSSVKGIQGLNNTSYRSLRDVNRSFVFCSVRFERVKLDSSTRDYIGAGPEFVDHDHVLDPN